ncbi:hypothetical protein [Absidia glauca]|uniref:Kinesin motor domain-containing protein n=1 Tax=Absidia glauca TaxID=4829 RepID=A0A163K3M8_ABSGL|nr:hypothetical protein [Absidia glauca]
MSLKDSDHNTLAAVQVAVRIRPLSDKDRSQPRFAHATNDDVLRAHENNTVIISPPHNKTFTFDHVFGPQTQQADIFAALGQKSIRKFVEGKVHIHTQHTHRPLPSSSLSTTATFVLLLTLSFYSNIGYNVTMLAYGQTSSGKTYTVGTAHHTGRYNPEQEGIVPRAMALLFDLLHQNDTRPTSPVASLSASSSVDGTTSSTSKGRLRPVSRISYSSFNNTGSSTSSSTSSTSSTSNNNNNGNKQKYKFTVKVSFVEIYNEELIDLLNFAPPNERPLVTIREDTKGQIYWTGVKEMNVNNTDDVLMYLQQGTQNRATGATDMNEQSSRSHAIFSVTLRQEKWTPSASASSHSNTPRTASPTSPRSKPRPLSAMNLRMNDNPASDEAGEWIITTSKLHFVDLAGSERLKRTAAEGDRRKEGININGGLLALGNVISALGDVSKKSTHIPYRDSKLTRLLQDSLGGTAMTLMIACVSPMEYNISETLNTLQYANRARNIKNRMEKNEVEEWLTTDNLELLRSTITKLKNELRQQRSAPQKSAEGNNRLSMVASSLSPMHRHLAADTDQLFQEHQMVVADLHRQLEELSTEVAVTRERNRIVENELKALQANGKGGSGGGVVDDVNDFERNAEPVIEQYETHLASYESRLSLTRAALNQSDFRIDELQTLTQNQEDMLDDLTAQLDKLKEQERHNHVYIEELEGKLSHTVKDAVQDEELLNELKNRIMKFKELDDSTELYILDLEKQLANNEADYTRKLDQHQQTITQQKERIEELEQKVNDLQANHTNGESHEKEVGYIKERQALHQQIAKLEHDLIVLTTQLQQQQQVSAPLIEIDAQHPHGINSGGLEEQQRLSMSSPPSAMDPNHEKRKRMFSSGNLPRHPGNKGNLLQSTLASLEHVQSEYVALKERYKHWTVASHTIMDDDSSSPPPPPPQGLAPTMSTGSSSSSSLDSIGTGTIIASSRKPPPPPSTTSSSSSSTTSPGSLQDLRMKCDDVVQQYGNQLQRIHGAIQRIAKLERTSSMAILPLSPTSPSSSPTQQPTDPSTSQQDVLVDLGQQLRDRQLSLQDACARFQGEMTIDLDQLDQLAPPTPSNDTEQPKRRHVLMEQVMQRLAKALQDVESHRSKTYVLQTKLQKIEVAFHTQQQRKSSASEDQDGIEQLMKKMDAIKIQLESRDVKSISVKE